MKKIILVMAITLFLASKHLLACSVHVDDNYQKNLLAAHGAGHLTLSLASVSSTTITDYSKSFLGSVGPSHCPEYLKTKAKVKFKYSPTPLKTCESTVVVTRQEFMGDEITEGVQFEKLSFESESVSCAISRLPRPCLPGRTCI